MLLRDALNSFSSTGFELVYSSGLINSAQRVEELPQPSLSTIEQIRFLLRPHALELELLRDNYGFIIAVAKSSAEYTPDNTRQTAPITMDSQNLLEEIWVTSTYRLGANDQHVHYVDQRDFDSLPSAGRDTLRAIATLPGITSNGVSANIRLRGGDQNEVLYMLDGQQIIEPFHLRNVHSLFSAINPNIIASANVYASGFSVSRGARMSGVVDLELHQPELGDTKTTGSLDINLISTAIDGRGAIGNKTWLISMRRSVIDTVLGQLETDYGRPQFHDELIRGSWEGTHNRIRVGLLNFADKISMQDERNFESGDSKFKYTNAWLHWQRELLSGSTADFKLSFVDADANRRGQLNDPLDSRGVIDQSSNYQISKLSIDAATRLGERNEIQWGGELQYQNGDFKVESSARFGVLGLQLGRFDQQLNSNQSRDGLMSTVYISATTEFDEQWSATAGLRYDTQDIDPVHEDMLSIRARVRYSPGDLTHFFLDLGRYTQHQNLYELQLDDGKAELDAPQSSDQLSVGLSHQFASGTLIRVDAYARNIKDPWSRFDNIYNRWVLLPELHADRIEIQASKARARGIEISARKEFSSTFAADMSYSYSRAEDKVDGAWIDRPWQQKHTVKLGIRWEHGDWTLGGFASYHSGWPSTARPNPSQAFMDTLYRESFPSYFALDLHIGRLVSTGTGELLLYADLLNSSNERNIGGYRYRQQAGEIRRKARHLFPIAPVIGLRWRW